MAEYIERGTAIAKLTALEVSKTNATIVGAKRLLAEIPAADVVPVVRCKDCYQSVVIGNVLHCTYWGKDTDENGYCHEGG